MIHVFLGILFVLLLPLSSQAEEENYCADVEAETEWEQIVKKHPDDMDFHWLHALRHGICWKIDKGDLTLEQGIEMFDRARDAVITKKIDEEGATFEQQQPL